MSEGRSYVGMSALVCPVCFKHHSEELLLDRRMIARFAAGEDIIRGVELCEDHLAAYEAGSVFIIEVEEDASHGETVDANDVAYTGRAVAINAEENLSKMGIEVTDAKARPHWVYVPVNSFNSMFQLEDAPDAVNPEKSD